MEQYEKQFENCRQWEKPFCTTACPFHVDILDFQEKMARKSFNAAYKTFRNAVGFPDIVAALCPEYCAACCPRQEDGSVRPAEPAGEDLRRKNHKKKILQTIMFL